MGSMIEINDTLQLTTEQGFPADLLDVERHRANPITLDDIGDRIFSFAAKPNARMFQLDPVRVYYVHNIDGKWLVWGHAMIQTETVRKDDAGQWVTDGTYRISQLYAPDYQELFTRNECPPGLSYFE
jgi:hypothetical protein